MMMNCQRIRQLLADEAAQGVVEYGIILGLIAVVAVIALSRFGPKVNGTLNNAASTLGD